MFKRFFSQGSGRYLLLLPVPLLWIFLGYFSALDNLREGALDLRFRARGPIPTPVKLIYVDIDTKAIGALGNFPWSHELFSQVCSALVEHGKVKGIGIDVVMSDGGIPQVADLQKWNSGHLVFGKFLFRGAPVVMAASYAGGEYIDESGKSAVRKFPLLVKMEEGEVGSPPEMPVWKGKGGLVLHPPLVGLIDTLGGQTRTIPLFAPLPGRTIYHMGLELSRLHLGVERSGIEVFDDRIDLRRPDGELALNVPLKDRQLMNINWFSTWESEQNPRTSFVEVLISGDIMANGTEEEQANAREYFAQFNNAIVLIGPVDRLLQDLAPTSFDKIPVPKVGVHGNVVKTILSGRFIKEMPKWSEGVIALILTVIVTSLVLAAGKQRGWWSRVLAMVILGLYVGVVIVAFVRFDLVVPLVVPLGAALTTSFLSVVVQLIIEEKQKGRIKGMFGTYVSPALVEKMVDSGEEPKLGGVEADITAYFSDIRDFSTFSEKLTPPMLVELMNEYLTVCTDVVQAEVGTLDKYIGDAVVAIYGAPLTLEDHAYRSCVAALTVHERVDALRQKWTDEGDKWPTIVKQLQTRIGLNSGPAVVGNMGSSTRFNYTMMGDTVNLAARMESGAKAYGVFTMVTEATKLQAEAKGGDKLVFRYLDRIQVKGRSQPVLIYELVDFKDKISDTSRRCVEIFEKAAALYNEQKWEEAHELFRQSADLEPNYPGVTPGVKTNPSLVMVERCLFMKANPPEADWDGVFVMKTK